MDESPQQRIGRNEALFRDVNEAIDRGRWQGEEDSLTAFRCECGRLGCTDLIELTPREYERIRIYPRRFALAVGHNMPDAEQVVETHQRYLVVEKLGQAGQVAQRRDPRA